MSLSPFKGLPRLYRANVSSRQHHADMVVFYEAPQAMRHIVLTNLLHTAWAVEVEVDLAIENVLSEQELLNEWAAGDASTGDARLFELGAGPQGISYVAPWRVQFFVSPLVLLRLLQAQWNLPMQPAQLRRRMPAAEQAAAGVRS